MIAASEPQEFVPSGRQQALRHPNSTRNSANHITCLEDDYVFDKFEKVSLKEKQRSNEWWLLRKTPNKHRIKQNSTKSNENNRCNSVLINCKSQNSDFIDDSLSFKNVEPSTSNRTNKRISDIPKSVQNQNDNNTTIGSNNLGNRVFSKTDDLDYMEDELYVKGNTVIWSRGLFNNNNNSYDDDYDNGRKIICCYTCPQQVKHALWCTFHCERPTFIDDFNKTDGVVNSIQSVCIIDTCNVRVFTEKGEDFIIAAPFLISNVWNTKYGIFLEKQVDSNLKDYECCKANLYSLAYPLDDVCPVTIYYNSSNLQIFNNNHLQIVYTNDNPSICMIYDAQTRQHSVYRIRKIRSSEKNEFVQKIHNTTYISTMELSNKVLKTKCSPWETFKTSNSVPVPSPVNSRPSSVSSFCHIPSKSHSSMATISRCQSPVPSTKSSHINTSLHGKTAASNCSFFDTTKTSYYHSNLGICLEYLWTEPYPTTDDTLSNAASKVFLCDDLTGQWYLSYIITTKYQLYMVKIDFTNMDNIQFGIITSIGVKDAVPIPGLHLLAILEHNGNVSLYSGLTPVGKLHIGGTLVQHTPSPYVRRNLSRFNSPFPRRSSLLPTSKHVDLKIDEHLLSPVLPITPGAQMGTKNILQVNLPLDKNIPKAILNGLQDPIENRLTLRYSDGTYYRITLPNLTTSSLIENCLTALCQCLTKDAVTVVLTRWYATRNALGVQEFNAEQEWRLFENLLLELIGYEDEQNSDNVDDCPVTPSNNAKRQKHSTTGSDDDWSFLLQSNHQQLSNDLTKIFNLPIDSIQSNRLIEKQFKINSNSILFPSIRFIHFSLHLLYEDLKLNLLRCDDLKLLVKLLNRLSRDLNLQNYSIYYWKDFPDICSIGNTQIFTQYDWKNINNLLIINQDSVISIFEFIYNLIEGRTNNQFYPYVKNINSKSRDIIQICGVILKDSHPTICLENLVKSIDSTELPLNVTIDKSFIEQACLLMVEKNIQLLDLDNLPPAIYLLFYSALWKCRENPPSSWPSEAYYLLWRNDLAAQAINSKENVSSAKKFELSNDNNTIVSSTSKKQSDQIDGMEDIDNTIMKLRFPDDVRVLEARKMLQSSKPVPIVLIQRPDVSDHDFIEEQEKHLYAVCTRTMALSVGRGMFTLRTSTPVITEPLQTPQLCLTGKAPPRGTAVELSHIDIPSNMNYWPLFHNGVANGLRTTLDANNIDNTWITFNKPKGSVEEHMEHAGFLMALGLNGHLKNLDILSTYDYLVKLHEMTSIGILLGLSAAFRGTCNQQLTKTLSVHVEALLPPTSMELDVPQNVQVAALLGVGLLYQSTSHRHIIEILLSEIGRPPGPEMENCIDRESYSLAAGLALGLVKLKQGENGLGLSDLNVPDTLHYYMIGGNRRPLTGSQKDKYKVPSFQIREGTTVNLDVTAPGATIALGLMYLGTGNKAVADWMSPPDTQYLLDFVRPDFLMLRILSRALIMWNEIEPTKEWVELQVPETIRPFCMVKPKKNIDIDYEAMNQAYCNIVTGACFALGLKYAGSANQNAFETLLQFCHIFAKLTMRSLAELAGKPTVETCLNVLLLSTAMVMAGTGNLDVMRLVRLLRRRVGITTSTVVTYGSHLAIHMALGLLFLGGGRYTLSNTPENIAALICAFYPKFPTHSNDNRYHLQAFRHLYVLAVEPRLVIPRDVHSKKSCYANLRIVKLDGSSFTIRGPDIIPDLNVLFKVSIEDERYWPVTFEKGRNWDFLIKILSTTGFIEVKQRAGCLNYLEDKFGYHSQLARTLTQSEIVPWQPLPESIVSFTNDECIKLFCDHFLMSEKSTNLQESKLKQILTKITYEAVVKDKLIIIPVVAFLLKMIQQLEKTPNSNSLWQMKLISAQILSKPISNNLLSAEIVLALEQQIDDIFEKWQNDNYQQLLSYLHGKIDDFNVKYLNAFVAYYDFPFNQRFDGEFLEILQKLQDRYPLKTIEKIVKLYNHECKQ